MRIHCKKIGLDYDSKRRICKIDADYCRSKGIDFLYNPNIQDYDCGVTDVQKASEIVLGTSVTRGTKHLLDKKNWSSCKNGDTDVGLLCRERCKEDYRDILGVCVSNKETYGRGVGRVPDVTCNKDFNKIGLGALSFCQKGFNFQNSKIGCSENEEINGVLCYPKCKEGYRNVGCCLCEAKDGLTYVPTTYSKYSPS